MVEFRFLPKLEVEAALQLQRLQAVAVHSELGTGALTALRAAGPASDGRTRSATAANEFPTSLRQAVSSASSTAGCLDSLSPSVDLAWDSQL